LSPKTTTLRAARAAAEADRAAAGNAEHERQTGQQDQCAVQGPARGHPASTHQFDGAVVLRSAGHGDRDEHRHDGRQDGEDSPELPREHLGGRTRIGQAPVQQCGRPVVLGQCNGCPALLLRCIGVLVRRNRAAAQSGQDEQPHAEHGPVAADQQTDEDHRAAAT
jgi:hypothetical protein